MFVASLLSVSLALVAGATPGTTASTRAETPAQTLWLVQPMYPGQDSLVKRTEEGITGLLPEDVKPRQLIGSAALANHLRGRTGDLSCLAGGARCREPLEAYLTSLGLERVVLLQVGQDDAGYRLRATSVRPETGARAQAETSNPSFDKALAGALVKFLSLNATVEARTKPAGATVFIDGVKMGVTPYSTEVLPGEHTFRFELASHLPSEATRVVASREHITLEPALEKVPARLVVKALPEGAEIYVDGERVGTDAVDRGVQPGTRTLRLALEGYEPQEVQAEIAPGATYTLERALKPTSMQAFKLAMRRRQEATLARHSYLEASYELTTLTSDTLETRPMGSNGGLDAVRTQNVRSPGKRRMRGLGLEYGHYGQYFGVMFVGTTWYSTGDTWTVGVNVPPGVEGPGVDGLTQFDTKVQMLSLRALQPQLRYVVGPVSFAIQAGVEVRGLLMEEEDDGSGLSPRFKDGLYAIDVHAGGQATARVFIYEGLYLSAAYQRGFSLLSKISGTSNFRGGVGYAF
ncbi:PEGA domain-containing protein [Myxococcus stipitatus]|uniref:PEGA domain-containing protein n=1 Tax=Myxococcus stipitatus TaxID=83455 RepID=UPI001F1A6309|nr:PEGA domain-containing protein [Myxococcus stipitatus]MCE9672691.1 PEGA domain-containing protein [Myxococcus stipitatus]